MTLLYLIFDVLQPVTMKVILTCDSVRFVNLQKQPGETE